MIRGDCGYAKGLAVRNFRSKINVTKIQYIMGGDWSNHLQADHVLRVDDGTIALVDYFKYIMDSKRTSSPGRPLHGKSKNWKSPLSRNLKLHFSRWPLNLPYSMELWAGHDKRVGRIPRQCLHKTLALWLKCALGWLLDQPRSLQQLTTSIHATEKAQTAFMGTVIDWDSTLPATMWPFILGIK